MILWVAVLLFLGLSIAFFLYGLAGALGISGTTSLQPVTEAAWNQFHPLFFGGEKGKPYDWEQSGPAPQDGVVYFDGRLVAMLKYLSQKRPYAVCGWDGQHDYIKLSRGCTPMGCTSTPPSNAPSASTVSRGVGIMLSQADYIKCEIHDKPGALCPPAQQCEGKPTKFTPANITFQQDKVVEILSNLPRNPDPAACEITCAVDYYPREPCDASEEDKRKPNISGLLAGVNPGEFPYDEIKNKYKQAAAFKAAQISIELMTVDAKECAVDPKSNYQLRGAENVGNQRMIPFQVIFPAWIWQETGSIQPGIMGLADERFPYNFQKNSTLAGLAYDSALNDKGLHFNY